jgi:site-specific DNA recombinase
MRYFHYCRKSTEDDDHQIASLDSQQIENEKRFGSSLEIEIAETYREAKSAKTPGRPIFAEMLDRIERGEADGIIAWHPDRLARNSVDGGRIIYLLDTGKLKDLKFSTYTFENTSQGKFMLQIVFANSKYYVDSLSENVKRGIRTKVEKGWRPNQPPIGYLNGEDPLPIIVDPERFALVQRMWQLALAGTYTLRQIRDIAAHDWGLRTKKRKRTGGTILTVSGTYALFKNPFYAGLLRLNGRVYPGKHQPMVTMEQFDLVQKNFGRPGAPQPKRNTWAYTGMIRCGNCGLAVTAEEKVNRFGYHYTYYHCTKRRGSAVCREPYTPLSKLEEEMERFLESITISDEMHAWAMKRIERQSENVKQTADADRMALEKAFKDNDTALRNLRQLRVRDQITDAEFTSDREALETERLRLQEQLAERNPADAFEPAKLFVSFCNRGLTWFREGDDEVRRLIIETAGSNPLLKARELTIDGRYPFRQWDEKRPFQQLCTVVDDIRTRKHREEMALCVARIKHIIQRRLEKYRGMRRTVRARKRPT